MPHSFEVFRGQSTYARRNLIILPRCARFLKAAEPKKACACSMLSPSIMATRLGASPENAIVLPPPAVARGPGPISDAEIRRLSAQTRAGQRDLEIHRHDAFLPAVPNGKERVYIPIMSQRQGCRF